MRLEQLYYLIEIAKYRSLSSASEQLHISQQALGAAMKNLEREIDVALLIRTPRGVYLTEEGNRLAQGANGLIADLQYLMLSIKRNDTYEKKAVVNLAAIYGTMETFLSDIVAQLIKNNQKLQVNVLEMTLQQMKEGLANGEIDIGLISFDKVTGLPSCLEVSFLKIMPMFSTRLCIRVARSSHLANYQSISLKTALKEPLLIYQPKAWENNPVRHTIGEYSKNYEVIIQENYQLHHQMLVNGVGISFASYSGRNVGQSDGAISYIPIKENIEIINAAVINSENQMQPNVQYVLNYLQMLHNGQNDI